MTRGEIAFINELLNTYEWPKGDMYKAMLQLLLKQPGRKLHKRDRKMLRVAEARAKAKQREQVLVEAKQRRNEKRQTRQIEAVRLGR